ncbi:DUF1294 domain-containing protein [Ramlibacter tataouinensis]|uniref:DUF1294 domain-containing protein n=1 Tax=Ramlibacter tataouinensis TaxID=94132 RepID=UPI0005A16A9C|nr:DUF1294 domain-containing protein [Ramlibacter tataouinensis]
MKRQGTVVRWDENRGFGFIRSTARGRGQPRKAGVPGRAPRHQGAHGESAAWAALPLMLAYAAMLSWAVWVRQWPWYVLPASLGLSFLTFFAYWQDKFAAEKGRWRIKEDTLHLWSLAGGWPGAWIAQQVLRHKSRKASFLAMYWTTVVLHWAGVLGVLFYA